MGEMEACGSCGATLRPTIVPTPEGKRSHAVGLQCSSNPQHGPDLP